MSLIKAPVSISRRQSHGSVPQWMSFEDIVKASRLQHLALLRDAAEDETLVRSMKRTSAAAALMFAVSCWVLTMDSSS